MVPVIGAVSRKSEPRFRNYVQEVCYRVPKGNWARHRLFFFFLILLTCLFGCVGSSLTLGLSLVVAQGLLVAVSSLVAEH